MLKKKGQLGVFLIIGIILLIVFLLYQYFAKQGSFLKAGEEGLTVPGELQPIHAYVTNCIQEVAVPGMYLLGIQGGVIFPKGNMLVTENHIVAYGHSYGENVLLKRGQMEQEMDRYMEVSLNHCLENFTAFQGQGKRISVGSIAADTTIAEEEVTIEVQYPITVEEEGARNTLEHFRVSIPIRLGHILDVAKAIIQKEQVEPESIAMPYLSQFDVRVDVLPYDEDDILYAILDNQSSIDTIPFQFLFASHLSLNQKPELAFIPDVFLKTGRLFSYQVQATDDDPASLQYSDTTDLFDIRQNGLIEFRPTKPGLYRVEITITDKQGAKDSQEVVFQVVP
ncbi:hypothetical protein HYS48_00125 [Candidatus Woesearchaeota archaeon]|nr:hypothetical protein [Candidatus Woesearchaeota archaeon]